MSSDVVRPDFTVTQPAIEALSEFGGAIRISLVDGGCCGTAYQFDQVDAASPEAGRDLRFGCEGAWLFVPEATAVVLGGATLDYSASTKPPRFRVLRNPNTPLVCPCRRSFGRAWPGKRQASCRSVMPMPWHVKPDAETPRA